MVVSLELVRIAGQVFSTPSDPGRPVAEPDLRHGPTTVRLLDLRFTVRNWRSGRSCWLQRRAWSQAGGGPI
jgi:hypothetical protein